MDCDLINDNSFQDHSSARVFALTTARSHSKMPVRLCALPDRVPLLTPHPQAYHSIFLQDQDVRLIGTSLLPTALFSPPSPHPLKSPILTHNPHRQHRPPPPPHTHPRPRHLPPRAPRLHLRHRRRPRKRILRPLRRSPLPLPRKHLLPELRDQGPGGSVADLWDPVRERVSGKDKAGDGGEGGGEGKWKLYWDGCWRSMGRKLVAIRTGREEDL